MLEGTVKESNSSSDIIKILGIGAISFGLNYLIFTKLIKKK